MTTLLDSEERIIEGRTPERMFGEHVARYEFASRHLAGLCVLDVACGTGYGSSRLRAAGAAEVLAIDVDHDAVAYGTQRYGRAGLRFLQGDAHDPLISGPFDAIVSFETIEHLDRPEQFLQTCRNLLAPGGLFFVSTPYRHDMDAAGQPKNPFHKQEWRTEEFEALLHRWFGSVELYGQALKLEKRRFQLNRRWAAPLAWVQGYRLRDPHHIFRLPGPRFGGLWQSYPAYLVALCR